MSLVFFCRDVYQTLKVTAIFVFEDRGYVYTKWCSGCCSLNRVQVVQRGCPLKLNNEHMKIDSTIVNFFTHTGVMEIQ